MPEIKGHLNSLVQSFTHRTYHAQLMLERGKVLEGAWDQVACHHQRADAAAHAIEDDDDLIVVCAAKGDV